MDKLTKHGVDVNIRDNDGRTLLHEAAKAGSAEIMDKLTKHGAGIKVER